MAVLLFFDDCSRKIFLILIFNWIFLPIIVVFLDFYSSIMAFYFDFLLFINLTVVRFSGLVSFAS
ncbi:hypothetical protein AL046_01400 [Pseudomonas syringae pv. avii]|nr:hypothetical protein AL046_01400 [Pseudomonas syringae pv. avii]